MGIRIRKSVSVGPLRFNLSKSGIGVSTGVKGFRVGTGPKGHYVSVGRDGVYYKKTFSGLPNILKRDKTGPGTEPEARPAPGPQGSLQEIESGDVLKMVDSSSALLLDELNEKHKKRCIWPFAAVLGAVVVLAAVASGSVLAIGLGIAAAVAVTAIVRRRDQMAKTVVLLYDLDADAEARFDALHDAFDAIASCAATWHVEAFGSSGEGESAQSILKRRSIRLTACDAPYLKSNVIPPRIPVGRQTLYLYPDHVLVFDAKGIGAVGYGDLRIDIDDHKLPEAGPAPRDAEIVGKTWRHARKDGGADKRYKDNPEIPIVLYESILFSSETGLNECILLSRKGIAQGLATAVAALADAGKSTQPWVDR